MINTQIPNDFQPSKQHLQGKIILITGATGGIGRCAALNFARAGATLILHGRNQAKLEELYDEIENEALAQAAIYNLDLASASVENFTEMHNALAQEFGCLDGLLLNAAELGPRTPIQHYSPEHWAKVMQVNVHANYMLCHTLLPLLKNSEQGRIVFTSDNCSQQGKAFQGAYSASKAALDNIMQTLADELDGIADICVNSVDPGPTRTRLRLSAYPAEDPMSVPSAEQLMPAYLYLLSSACQHSGQRFLARANE